MTELRCDDVVSGLPALVAGSAKLEGREGVERHLARCDDCAEAREVVRGVLAGRAHPPAEVLDKIRATLRDEAAEGGFATMARRRTAMNRRWGVIAAAVVVLGVSLPFFVSRGEVGGLTEFFDSEGTSMLKPEWWSSEDVVVAGAPLLSGLSTEALVLLMEEMTEDDK